MARRRPNQQVYRLRPGVGGRIVTAPDGTVSVVGDPGPDGIRTIGALKEPFASLFAETFNPARFIRAVGELEPVQRERIRKPHEKLGSGKRSRGSR